MIIPHIISRLPYLWRSLSSYSKKLTSYSVSIQEAEESSRELRELVVKTLDLDNRLARRFERLQMQRAISPDPLLVDNASSILSKDECDTIHPCASENGNDPSGAAGDERYFGFAFEEDLQATRVYGRITHKPSYLSLPSSAGVSRGLSYLSEFSLSQVSNISVISLPVSAAELYNFEHYSDICYDSSMPGDSIHHLRQHTMTSQEIQRFDEIDMAWGGCRELTGVKSNDSHEHGDLGLSDMSKDTKLTKPDPVNENLLSHNSPSYQQVDRYNARWPETSAAERPAMAKGDLYQKFDRDKGLQTAMREYIPVMKKFRAQYGETKTWTSFTTLEKLMRLSHLQVLELSQEVYDDLRRRNAEANQDSTSYQLWTTYLPLENHSHPQRNEARKKLSTLSVHKFCDLIDDVTKELTRRCHELANSTPIPQGLSSGHRLITGVQTGLCSTTSMMSQSGRKVYWGEILSCLTCYYDPEMIKVQTEADSDISMVSVASTVVNDEGPERSSLKAWNKLPQPAQESSLDSLVADLKHKSSIRHSLHDRQRWAWPKMGLHPRIRTLSDGKPASLLTHEPIARTKSLSEASRDRYHDCAIEHSYPAERELLGPSDDNQALRRSLSSEVKYESQEVNSLYDVSPRHSLRGHGHGSDVGTDAEGNDAQTKALRITTARYPSLSNRKEIFPAANTTFDVTSWSDAPKICSASPSVASEGKKVLSILKRVSCQAPPEPKDGGLGGVPFF